MKQGAEIKPPEPAAAPALAPQAAPAPESDPVAPDPAPAARADVFRGPLESALRHPILTLLPLIAAIGAAAALGLERAPVYSADARINVGRVDVPAYTLQGVTIGNSTLAASYARAIIAPEVVTAAARKARVPVQAAAQGLSASQVPRSTLIGVEADAPTEAQAVALANAGADELIAYVTKLNLRQERSANLSRYRAASRRVQRAALRVQALTARGAATRRGLRTKLEKARTELATRQIAAAAIAGEINRGAQAPNSKNLLQLIVPAAEASSDRDDVLQQLLIIAAVSGLVIGLALALLRTNWGYLRRARS